MKRSHLGTSKPRVVLEQCRCEALRATLLLTFIHEHHIARERLRVDELLNGMYRRHYRSLACKLVCIFAISGGDKHETLVPYCPQRLCHRRSHRARSSQTGPSSKRTHSLAPRRSDRRTRSLVARDCCQRAQLRRDLAEDSYLPGVSVSVVLRHANDWSAL